MGTLYIVSTPIGNLGDITLRALETLKGADIILCEDTRKTAKLLRHYEIKKPLISYFEYNEAKRTPQIIRELQSNRDIALVTDAGTPLLSDPGYKLVSECIRNGIDIFSIPGPSAVLAALVLSGLPMDKFIFLGYLPKKVGKRKRLLDSLASGFKKEGITVAIYESPHRLLKTLQDIEESLGNVEIAISRELTKIYEETLRLRISEAIEHFKKISPKGEFSIIFKSTP